MNDKLSSPLFLAILCTLMAFASLSIDLYLPAMPLMERELHGNVELTVTAFLIGFSIAQLIWGPISDAFGRRLPLFIGMLMFIAGSAGCALSMNIAQIVFWRVVQAFGACTGPMLARAMIRDSYSQTQAARMFSTLFFFMAVAPILGPLIGGQIIRFCHWNVIFEVLMLIGGLMFISLFALPETLPKENRVRFSFTGTFHNYLVLVKNRNFMRYTLCLTFFYVAAYAYMAGSPFVYIRYFGVAPQNFGWLFALNILGVMAMSMMNRHLVLRYSLKQLLKVAVIVATLAALILAVVVKIKFGGIIAVAMAILLFFSMNGIIAANTTTAALDSVPSLTGSASAVIGALQYGSGIVSSLLLAFFKDGTPWTMAWIMLIFTLASVVTLLLPHATRSDIEATA
ncbi:multidrug effflux MFS transporter [Celerinatantimonas diazotrophica]|uniref:Bcr/CflA family efflux transporter n=1 Tax=Celerinatantimonas diazotrophica TaxID=412034 RepID=A0A4R1K3Z1_9GAMM|nr:multidrug effflux MFS transporter [Celerinatantimonas diazotrophica]TCK58812.1 DHA1 family bicyclomycin/chloramphenicol resistance-like MFS transporter [Celerinatantimonas diazotrophica]CAG9297444.1 Bicyclomycin resistance protein [Celerinatantimonas diazotrophica]